MRAGVLPASEVGVADDAKGDGVEAISLQTPGIRSGDVAKGLVKA